MKPMLLKPYMKTTIWGGERLKKEFNKDFDGDKLGETWECSVHPHGSSIVASGEYTGKTLRQVLKEHPEYLGKKVPKGKEFPIMIKLIDAKEDLSLQVHPDDEYAQKVENQNGKTEMWYVVETDADARIVHGFTHNMTCKLVEESLAQNKLLEQLQQVEVHPGDVFFTPAGTIHGIGKGCLIAEVQQNSDVTYRVHDYDRVDSQGNKRELHLEKALDVMELKAGKNLLRMGKLVKYYPGYVYSLLCRCEYFNVEKYNVKDELQIQVLGDSFQSILCLQGSAKLKTVGSDEELFIRKGDSLFLPASLGALIITGELEFLLTKC